MVRLGVNVDHVATVRQARRSHEPDPVWAAVLAELGGADGITVHLREDRRHIQDHDVERLRQTVSVKLNLEMSCAAEIVDFACRIRPQQATLVPERREEVTTEGGLDVCADRARVKSIIDRLKGAGIEVSLFLDPKPDQIEAGREVGADAVELHTGSYSLARGPDVDVELARLVTASERVRALGMVLHAGHGLNYHNVGPVAAIAGMSELNIGHSLVARATLVGMERAVAEMKRCLASAGRGDVGG